MEPPRRDAVVLLALVVALNVRAFGAGVGWDFTDADAWADVAWAVHPLSEQVYVKLTGGVAGDDANFWRPTAMLQFWVERRLFGWNALGWHVWNIAEHTLATLLAALFVARTARFAGVPARALTWLVALGFAVHPLTEDVVPAIARNIDLLLGVGVFGALVGLVRVQEGQRGGWLLYVGATALALGAKESAVLLLPLVVVWVVLFREGRRVAEAVRMGIPVALLIGAYLVLRHQLLGGVGGYWAEIRAEWVWAALERVFIEPFVPSIGAWCPRGWRTLVPLAIVWSLILYAAWRSPHRRLAIFGGAWFLGASALYIATGTCSRRVFYVPTLGGLLVIGAALTHAWRHPLGAVLGAAWIGTMLHGSPAVVRYTQWKEVAAASEVYRDINFWKLMPTGSKVWLAERPFRADLDPRTFRFWGGRGRSLHHGAPAYALEAWLDEVLPDKRLEVATLTGTALMAPVARQELIVKRMGASLRVVHHGADRQRWEVRSPFRVVEDGDTLRITPVKPNPGGIVVIWTPDGLKAWNPDTGDIFSVAHPPMQRERKVLYLPDSSSESGPGLPASDVDR